MSLIYYLHTILSDDKYLALHNPMFTLRSLAPALSLRYSFRVHWRAFLNIQYSHYIQFPDVYFIALSFFMLPDGYSTFSFHFILSTWRLIHFITFYCFLADAQSRTLFSGLPFAYLMFAFDNLTFGQLFTYLLTNSLIFIR